VCDLVVIHKVNIDCTTIVESENDTPVATDGDAPIPFEVALQRMQPVSRKINIRWLQCRIKVREHIGYALRLIRPNLARVSILEKAAQAPMTERPNHRTTVPCIATRVNNSMTLAPGRLRQWSDFKTDVRRRLLLAGQPLFLANKGLVD
jgi:hypothetical protein